MAIRTYRSKVRLAAAAALVGAVAAGIVAGRIARLGEPGQNFWLVFVGLLAICALAFAAAYPWWRKLDDVQRDGHLVSWYWGGMAGGVVMLMSLIAAGGPGDDLAQGGGLIIAAQGLGFLLFLAVWQLRHRGPEA